MLTQKARREERERKRDSTCTWGRETPSPLRPLSMFFPPPGPALCKLGQPGLLVVLPEVLTLAFGPSFVLFLQPFSFLFLYSPSFWIPFPYSTYLTFYPLYHLAH